MKPQTLARNGLLRSIEAFRPQQAPVARKNLSAMDTLAASVPKSVFMQELRKAGDEHLCPVAELIELHRQVQIAEKVPDMYALLMNFDLEWRRFSSMFPEASADGWLSLLVNRARVLRDEIDEISHAGRA
jgi:hypothetical protein